MSGSVIGNIFTVSTWGESHGKALGVVVDGCPAGLALSENDIQKMPLKLETKLEQKEEIIREQTEQIQKQEKIY